MKKIRTWPALLFIGYLLIIGFLWAVEFFDLPHILLKAEASSVNWEESLLETLFMIIMWGISWKLITYYELEWEKAKAELMRLVSTDSLTGALSRREFLAKAEEEFLRAKRFNRPFTCGIIDLDSFKFINDHFGHLEGDKVLKEFIQIATGNIRQQDFIGRLGGDEFGIVFVETTKADAYLITNRLNGQWNLRNLTSDDGRKLTLSFSTGISSTLETDQSLVDCIRRTDKALYDAKQVGKNRIELA